MSRYKAAGKACLVCHRGEAVSVTLPSGMYAELCGECANDRHRIAEAEKRVK